MNILGEAYGTISDIEIFWVLMTSVALAFSLYNTWEAIQDYRFFRKQVQSPTVNGRQDQATGTIVAEVSRTVILLIFLSIGIGAMIIPEPPHNLELPLDQRIVSALIRWGLILSAILILLQTLNNARIRRRTALRAKTRAALEEKWRQGK